MPRLYAITSSVEEIAACFEVPAPDDVRIPRELVEGMTGPVIIERDGTRFLKPASWGFPRQTSEMEWKGEPVGRIGLVANLTNPLWDRMAVDPRYRCLIPMSHFANPDGASGKNTRAWFSASDRSLMAWAGFVRKSDEFGVVYAGLTMDANELVKPYNDRMPLLVGPNEYDRWLHGAITDVIAMQFRPPPPSESLIIHHTKDRWNSGIVPRALHAQQTMLM
jgi:putative SOS response-associated peptidase YedK